MRQKAMSKGTVVQLPDALRQMFEGRVPRQSGRGAEHPLRSAGITKQLDLQRPSLGDTGPVHQGLSFPWPQRSQIIPFV